MIPTVNEVRDLVAELQLDNLDRNNKDDMLMTLFEEGNFTGLLNRAIKSQARTSEQRKLLVNICRRAMIDRISLLTMIPDIRVEPPDALPH